MSKELMNTTEMKEVISKRTACMKVFEHADHRFTAAIYGTPVHYMKDGRWEEIDNRLEAAADKVPADADDMENISGGLQSPSVQQGEEKADRRDGAGQISELEWNGNVCFRRIELYSDA